LDQAAVVVCLPPKDIIVFYGCAIHPLNVDVSFPMSAVYQSTAPDQVAPWANARRIYRSANGERASLRQKFSVKMDPRVQSTTAQLQEQF